MDILWYNVTAIPCSLARARHSELLDSPKDESGVLKAVQHVHAMIDRIESGTNPDNVFTPILWAHGMDDRTVLSEAGQLGPSFLEQAGVSCEFKAFPSLDHSISGEELRYLESWIKTRLQSSSS
ncbi:hypothetical protein ACH5RR_017541 [Cinchona calisaya]|uniref:Phospholipase/carboxylesterase/thioesterase domain-containing protein n=1 Tax=Cinchona calisaya TaxID=153742 RepID=A0ABD2ZMM6_9GENT